MLSILYLYKTQKLNHTLGLRAASASTLAEQQVVLILAPTKHWQVIEMFWTLLITAETHVTITLSALSDRTVSSRRTVTPFSNYTCSKNVHMAIDFILQINHLTKKVLFVFVCYLNEKSP